MSANRSEQRGRLLNEVLQDEPFKEFEARLRQQALAEFRRGQAMRKVASISSLAALVVASALGSFFFLAGPPKKESSPASDRAASPGERPAALAKAPGKTVSTLTDEELIASFPPNSCYLAEVDGRQVLVFRDSKLRSEYLR